MRILHAISSVNPAGGGPIEGIKQLGRINTQRGHVIEVASLDPPDSPYLKDFPLPLFPLGPGQGRYQFSPSFIPWLRKNMDRYDIVVVNGIWQHNGFGVWHVLRKSSMPYVVVTHGMLDPWFKRTYPVKHLKKWLYWPWGQYRVLRDAAAVLFTSEEERLLARESFWLYSAKEKVISYGTASPIGDQKSQVAEFVASYPNLADKRILLFLGRIDPKKGCDLAVESFGKVMGADPRWHLVMAGPDQSGWKSSLESLAAGLGIAERVTWTGMLRGNVKIGALRSAEAFFLPSHSENFGIVVAEALACGTPVLISNKVNIWREIQADGSGFVAPDTLDGSSSLLRQWLEVTEADKHSMRLRARQTFEDRFEISRASDALLDVLQSALHEKQVQSRPSKPQSRPLQKQASDYPK